MKLKAIVAAFGALAYSAQALSPPLSVPDKISESGLPHCNDGNNVGTFSANRIRCGCYDDEVKIGRDLGHTYMGSWKVNVVAAVCVPEGRENDPVMCTRYMPAKCEAPGVFPKKCGRCHCDCTFVSREKKPRPPVIPDLPLPDDPDEPLPDYPTLPDDPIPEVLSTITGPTPSKNGRWCPAGEKASFCREEEQCGVPVAMGYARSLRKRGPGFGPGFGRGFGPGFGRRFGHGFGFGFGFGPGFGRGRRRRRDRKRCCKCQGDLIRDVRTGRCVPKEYCTWNK